MRKFTKKKQYEAMHFSTNNDKDSHCMDAIVRWMNSGSEGVRAWHNGTDIYVKVQSGWRACVVGEWIVKLDYDYPEFYSSDEFEKKFAEVVN